MMDFKGVSEKQRAALILKARGFKDREAAPVLGIKQRADVCKLRQRGRQAIARVLAARGSELTTDEVIASMVRLEAAASKARVLAAAS